MYELTQEQQNRIFQNLLEDLAELYTPQDHPIALFLAGQPGSGKSAITKTLLERFEHLGEAIVIDGDELIVRHPQYQEALRNNETGLEALRPHGVFLVHRLIEHVCQVGYNVIIEQEFELGGKKVSGKSLDLTNLLKDPIKS